MNIVMRNPPAAPPYVRRTPNGSFDLPEHRRKVHRGEACHDLQNGKQLRQSYQHTAADENPADVGWQAQAQPPNANRTGTAANIPTQPMP